MELNVVYDGSTIVIVSTVIVAMNRRNKKSGNKATLRRFFVQ